MRTTVNIDDQLLFEAKNAAARSHRSLSELVNDALRALLAERPAQREGPVHLPTYGGSGLRAGVDLQDKDALAELLDGVEPSPRAAG